MNDKITITIFGRRQDYTRAEATNIFLNAYYAELQSDDKEKYDYILQSLIGGYSKIDADKKISS